MAKPDDDPHGTDAIYLVGSFFSSRYGAPILLFMKPGSVDTLPHPDDNGAYTDEATIEELLTKVDFACVLDHDELQKLLGDLYQHHAEMHTFQETRAQQAKLN